MGFEDILKDMLGNMGRQLEKELGVSGPRPLPQSPQPQSKRPQSQRSESSSNELPPAHDHDEGGISGIMHAVVQVVALRQGFMGGMSSVWTGSGTIVHPAGVILTNCHVANPRAMGMSSPPADRMGIAITDRSDEPPALSYYAEVVQFDPRLDLAVLRIVADVRGQPVRNLQLPAVDLGDSDTLKLGARLAIFGYPGIGGETVTYTSGNVSGFGREKGLHASRAWVKTDATIAGGNSGGTAVNQSGQLVGIPTQAAAGSGIVPVDARPVVDTNRDGRIDQRDTPMAIGGFINGLRPVNLAIGLLEKAGMHIDVDRSGRVKRQQAILPPSGPVIGESATVSHGANPRFSELLFSTQVTRDGRPINPTTQIPSGGDTVYATFEYSGMKSGTPWSVVWISDGQQIIDQQDKWDEGPQGRKAVKVSNRKGLPAGEYHLVLGIGGSVALEGKVIVGNPVDETDSEISGSLVDGRTGQPVAEGMVMVLHPGASLRKFLQTQDREAIYVSANTGSDGRFTFPKQLPKGQAYSLVALARGYQPVAVDGALRISSTAPEQADIGNIKMAQG